MKHALVVGGSGMLAKTSLWLADNGYLTSVVGRNEKKLNKLVKRNSSITPISVDYYNEDQILGMIGSEIENASTNEWELYHVLGSSKNLDEIDKSIDISAKCLYHQVQLGFILYGNRSRWLTHDEISNGVITCIQNKLKKFVVGTLEPWDKRP